MESLVSATKVSRVDELGVGRLGNCGIRGIRGGTPGVVGRATMCTPTEQPHAVLCRHGVVIFLLSSISSNSPQFSPRIGYQLPRNLLVFSIGPSIVASISSSQWAGNLFRLRGTPSSPDSLYVKGSIADLMLSRKEIVSICCDGNAATLPATSRCIVPCRQRQSTALQVTVL